MNDYWNDPPETEEGPECCGDEMVVFPDAVTVCEHCGSRFDYAKIYRDAADGLAKFYAAPRPEDFL